MKALDFAKRWGLWQGLFCVDAVVDEEILCDVSKYERTAFAIIVF